MCHIQDSGLHLKGNGYCQRKLIFITFRVSAITSTPCIWFQSNLTERWSSMRWCVVHKIQASISKVKVAGQRSLILCPHPPPPIYDRGTYCFCPVCLSIRPSVRPSVCLSICLSVWNFNVAYNFWTKGDFGLHIEYQILWMSDQKSRSQRSKCQILLFALAHEALIMDTSYLVCACALSCWIWVCSFRMGQLKCQGHRGQILKN